MSSLKNIMPTWYGVMLISFGMILLVPSVFVMRVSWNNELWHLVVNDINMSPFVLIFSYCGMVIAISVIVLGSIQIISREGERFTR